jgi:hypothetical protein
MDAAIPHIYECKHPRRCGIMYLLLLIYFVVAGAGFGEAPTIDIAA